jgi:hypothetical protein
MAKPPADLHVISWNQDDARAIEGGREIGWWGGFFENGMRWKDYLEAFEPDMHPYLEAARKSAVANNIKATGAQHQYDGITPVFSDGSTFAMTFRAWGDFMAAVWSEEQDTDMGYMDFYM